MRLISDVDVCAWNRRLSWSIAGPAICAGRFWCVLRAWVEKGLWQGDDDDGDRQQGSRKGGERSGRCGDTSRGGGQHGAPRTQAACSAQDARDDGWSVEGGIWATGRRVQPMVEPLGHELRCALLIVARPDALPGQHRGSLEGLEGFGAKELLSGCGGGADASVVPPHAAAHAERAAVPTTS